MVAIILFDFFTMIIPNWLNALLFIGFIGTAFLVKMPYEQVGWHLLTAAILLLIGFAVFAANFFGGGDAKSVAAIGAWVGWELDIIYFMLIMAIFGGILAGILLLIRLLNIKAILPKKINDISWVNAIITPKMRMPYGVAIGAAGLVLYAPDKWIL